MADIQQTTEPEAQHLFFETPSLKDVPDRIQVLPVGVFNHPTYGTVDLSMPVLDEIVDNFNARVYGQTLPINIEHDPNSGAAGHITGLIRNDDGSVDATVDWNPHGRQALAEDRFRYISPELRNGWENNVTKAKYDHLLVGAGLTVRPFFKSEALRPLIVASEPVGTDHQKGTVEMTEATPTPVENDGKAIVDQKFGEKIAVLEGQVQTFADKLVAVEAENTRLKADAEARAFREEVVAAKWPGDVDEHIANLQELSEAGKERYRKQMTTAKNQLFVEGRKPVGSDAIGSTSDAMTQLNAAAAKLQEANPALTPALAFTEAARINPELSRKAYAETAQA